MILLICYYFIITTLLFKLFASGAYTSKPPPKEAICYYLSITKLIYKPFVFIYAIYFLSI